MTKRQRGCQKVAGWRDTDCDSKRQDRERRIKAKQTAAGGCIMTSSRQVVTGRGSM